MSSDVASFSYISGSHFIVTSPFLSSYTNFTKNLVLGTVAIHRCYH